MGDVSGGNGSVKIHLFYQQDLDLKNGDVSSGNVFINNHTLYQCNYSSSFMDMDGNFKNGDVSGGHGSLNSHSLYQQYGLKPFINLNNSDDIQMNDDLNISYVSRGIGLIKIHTLSQVK